jgi:hypothetical protein
MFSPVVKNFPADRRSFPFTHDKSRAIIRHHAPAQD